MAHFYANIKGARGEKTCCATKNSGITAHIRGWDSGVSLQIEEINGIDVTTIYLTAGSNAKKESVCLGYFQDNTFSLKAGVKSPLGKKIRIGAK